MKRSWTIVTLVVLLALALAACGGDKPTAAPAAGQWAQGSNQPASNSAEPTDKPAGKPAPTATAEEASTEPTPAADDTLDLSSRDAGLDQLKSYRMRWQAQWQSTESGKTDSANWDWTEEYSSDPEAVHWVWKVVNAGESSASQGGDMELWQIGKTSYMVTKDDQGKGECMSFSSDDDNNQISKGIFSPNSLGSLSNARYAGTEDVNGVKAKHYKYDEKSTTLAGFGKVSGETWVAVDGGFVVKDVMNWQGAAGLFGSSSSAKGDGKWTWELSNVNGAVDIKAPENCGGAANSMPMMADASEKSSFGDMTTYKTASKMADVAAFYTKEMAATGWTADGEPEITEEIGMLAFKKDGQTAQVTLTSDEGKTQVMINVTKD